MEKKILTKEILKDTKQLEEVVIEYLASENPENREFYTIPYLTKEEQEKLAGKKEEKFTPIDLLYLQTQGSIIANQKRVELFEGAIEEQTNLLKTVSIL